MPRIPALIGQRWLPAATFVVFETYGKHCIMIIVHTSVLDQVRHARGAVMAANEAAIEMRRAARQREKEEVESILAYQAMKVNIQDWR